MGPKLAPWTLISGMSVKGATQSPSRASWQYKLICPIVMIWRGSVNMLNIQIHCEYTGGWFIFKSRSRGRKCPVELTFPIDIDQKCSWLKKSSLNLSLHFQDATNKVIRIVTCLDEIVWRKICRDSRLHLKFSDNLPTFPTMKSFDRCLKLLLICLGESLFSGSRGAVAHVWHAWVVHPLSSMASSLTAVNWY